MLEYTLLQIENLEKEIVAVLIIAHKSDEQRRTMKYLKFNRWIGNESKFLVALRDHLPEFGRKIRQMGYDLFSTNPGSKYLKSSWSILYAADCEYDLDCINDFGLSDDNKSNNDFYQDWHKLVLPEIVAEIVAEIGENKCAVKTGKLDINHLYYKFL